MKNIKILRGKLGLTQLELAEKLGITRVYMTTLESESTTSLSEELAHKLCEIFNVKEYELLGINNLKYIPATKEEFEKFCDGIKKEYY